MSFIPNRHSVANNPYIKNYDKSKPTTYISYEDANNLYGFAMCQRLAVGDYKLEEVNDWTTERIMNLKEDDERGYIFEVDIEYPEQLHDLHNDYPLCPEKKLITNEMLSPFQKCLMEKLYIK